MAKSGITWDTSGWRKKSKKLAALLGKEEGPFVREQAGLFMRDISKFVPPYEKFPSGAGASIGSSRDKKIGELAIKSDLLNIFFVPDDRAAYHWAKDQFPSGPVWGGKRQTGAGVIRNLAEMKLWHEKKKNFKGRTNRLKAPEKMWTSDLLFKRYYNLEKKKVGIAKASTAKSAIRLNPKIRIPAWVRRHVKTASGSARMSKTRGGPTAFFNAKAAGLQHVSSATIVKMQQWRVAAMERRLFFLLKKSGLKAGFRVKSS